MTQPSRQVLFYKLTGKRILYLGVSLNCSLYVAAASVTGNFKATGDSESVVLSNEVPLTDLFPNSAPICRKSGNFLGGSHLAPPVCARGAPAFVRIPRTRITRTALP
jgi:hypothetical protein